MATNKKKTKYKKKGKSLSKNKSSKGNNVNVHVPKAPAKTTNEHTKLLTNTKQHCMRLFHLLLFLIKIIYYEVISLPFFFILDHLLQPSPPTTWPNKMGMIIYFGELVEYKQKYSNLSPFAIQQWAHQQLRELSLKEGVSIPSSLQEGITQKPCSILPPYLLFIEQYDYLCNVYSYLHDINIIKPTVYVSYMLVLTLVLINLSPLELELDSWHNVILALLVIITSIIYYKNEPKYDAAGKKNPLKQALTVAMTEFISQQRALYESSNNKSSEESQAWIIKMRSNSNTSPFGFVSSKNKGTVYGKNNKKKTLWNEIIGHPAVQKELEDGNTESINSKLWQNSFNEAWPYKSRDHKGTKRKVGDITVSAATNTKSGKAKENVEKELGLVNLLGGQANFTKVMRACEALRTGDTSTVIEGMYGGFNKTTAELIAYHKIGECIDLLVEQYGLNSRDDVLGRLESDSLWDFIGYTKDLAGLEVECRDVAMWESQKLGLTRDHTEPASDLEQGRGTKLFLTCLNILVGFENITDGLIDRKLVTFVDKYGCHRLLALAGKKMSKQYCVGGGTVQQGLEASDFDRHMLTNGFTLVEMFQAEYSEDQVLVLNMNGKASVTGKKDRNNELGNLLPIPETDRYVRNCSVSLDTSEQNLVRYMASLGGLVDKRTKTLHQLTYYVGAHNGFGLIKSAMVRQYLGLTEDQGWEDVPRFVYHRGFDEKSRAAIEARKDRLEKKGWETVKMAPWCDMDHLVGRSQVWMNSNIFILSCSHSWNTQMSYVRIFYKDWGYAWAQIPYGSGND